MSSHPKRYLGNKDSKIVHDTYKEQTNCQLSEIKDENKEYFDTLNEAASSGYKYYCFWCLYDQYQRAKTLGLSVKY